MRPPEVNPVHAVIDRIDAGVAVLITCGGAPERLTFPARLLPEGSREGDIVSIRITVEPGAAESARGWIAPLIDRLRKR